MSTELDDRLAAIGDVPSERVWLQPPPGQATVADVLMVRGSFKCRICELVEGTLVEIAYDFRASALSTEVLSPLVGHCREHHLGIVLGTAMFVQLRPGLIRAPCISFYS